MVREQVLIDIPRLTLIGLADPSALCTPCVFSPTVNTYYLLLTTYYVTTYYLPSEAILAHDRHHSDSVTLLGRDAIELEGEHLVSRERGE